MVSTRSAKKVHNEQSQPFTSPDPPDYFVEASTNVAAPESPFHNSSTPRTPLADPDMSVTKRLFSCSPPRPFDIVQSPSVTNFGPRRTFGTRHWSEEDALTPEKKIQTPTRFQKSREDRKPDYKAFYWIAVVSLTVLVVLVGKFVRFEGFCGFLENFVGTSFTAKTASRISEMLCSGSEILSAVPADEDFVQALTESKKCCKRTSVDSARSDEGSACCTKGYFSPTLDERSIIVEEGISQPSWLGTDGLVEPCCLWSAAIVMVAVLISVSMFLWKSKRKVVIVEANEEGRKEEEREKEEEKGEEISPPVEEGDDSLDDLISRVKPQVATETTTEVDLTQFGSFVEYMPVPAKQNPEKVALTPVRRSNRIRKAAVLSVSTNKMDMLGDSERFFLSPAAKSQPSTPA